MLAKVRRKSRRRRRNRPNRARRRNRRHAGTGNRLGRGDRRSLTGSRQYTMSGSELDVSGDRLRCWDIGRRHVPVHARGARPLRCIAARADPGRRTAHPAMPGKHRNQPGGRDDRRRGWAAGATRGLTDAQQVKVREHVGTDQPRHRATRPAALRRRHRSDRRSPLRQRMTLLPTIQDHRTTESSQYHRATGGNSFSCGPPSRDRHDRRPALSRPTTSETGRSRLGDVPARLERGQWSS
jgi:hypothetical protein